MEKPHKTAAELFAAQALASQLKAELTKNILPYWMGRVPDSDGGMYGRISGEDIVDPSAPVGNIMVARILWTFASAYRILKDGGDPVQAKRYLDMALMARNLIIKRFYDPEFGGSY